MAKRQAQVESLSQSPFFIRKIGLLKSGLMCLMIKFGKPEKLEYPV
jgi:hypothetical protein